MKAFLIALLFLAAVPAHAQELVEPSFAESVFKSEVVSIDEAGERVIEGTELTEEYQVMTVRIVEGARSGEVITLENDSSVIYKPGDRFYLHRAVELGDDVERFTVWEPDRTPVLIILTFLFVLVAVLVAGWAGARSLVALALSFGLIIFGLLPALGAGWPPVPTSVGLGVVILALSMFVTHGVNRPTWVALLGSIVALAVAAAIAQIAVTAAKLTGYASDEAVFLNFATSGSINLTGLLLGGILVGIIGVLNDVSVSQVHTVVELHDANPELSRHKVWRKAMKVGREHMGAVVNTLPLAYAGVSLPLLLLFSQSDAPFSFIVNREVFTAEIIRALAGSIGLMLAGVIATIFAIWILVPKTPRATIPTKQ